MFIQEHCRSNISTAFFLVHEQSCYKQILFKNQQKTLVKVIMSHNKCVLQNRAHGLHAYFASNETTRTLRSDDEQRDLGDLDVSCLISKL